MSTDRFHKAAKDGLIEVLKETTRRDCNGRDEQGMTPTLYAAFYGHLEALRLLCGRGGDPDKADYFGNTALHLAAAQGHKAVVTFLVNFGANVYSMDIDEHTPQELAGINNRDDILRFLDTVTAKLEAGDKKKSKALKEKAKKDAEKRIREYNKRQAKADAQAQKYQKRVLNEYKVPSVINTWKQRIKSGSMSNLTTIGPPTPKNTFSALVSGGTISGTKGIQGTVQRKALAKNMKSTIINSDDFKISEIEDGKRSVRSITGLRRDSEVMYGGTIDNKRGRLNNVFKDDNFVDDSDSSTTLSSSALGSGLTRSLSQPDFINEINNVEPIHQEPSSIFVRPGIGNLAFRKSVTSTLHALSANEGLTEESSIGSAGSLAVRQRHFTSQPFDDELSDSESSEEESLSSALERFLTAWGLNEYVPRFEEQKIDLDTLMLLTDSDLKTLNLPLGPYRKLVTAISERKSALENPGELVDGPL